jgi:hypothetical protein
LRRGMAGFQTTRCIKIRVPVALFLVIVFGLALLSAGCAAVKASKPSGPTGPTVSITSPANGATVSGTVAVAATATDNVGVTAVQFQIDNANVGSVVTTSPYSYSWDTTKVSYGSHTLRATAQDAAGNTGTSTNVTVSVNNSKSTTPPTVSITSPTNGATVSGTVAVAATATDNVGVTAVQFQIDNANVGSVVTTSPYSYSWDTTKVSNGSHTLRATAQDAAGNTGTSTNVTVSVNNSKSTTPPTVSITSPTNGATVSGTITVTATATATSGVSTVQFLLDGADLGAAASSNPYSVSWNTAAASNGSHVLAAKVTDYSGNTATSNSVNITVSQSAPPPPPPPVGDEVTISDASGAGQTNRAVSIARAFVQGEIPNFAEASINGTAITTQCDVKNRWPDGSLKFAVVSFVVPSIPSSGSVVVSFSNQTSGNNTGFLAQSDMMGSGYNFDGQIQLTGAASHNISARAILSQAGSCNDPGNDPDGGQFKCTYWLKGPIVTAVILEDRLGRSFDVNTDGGAGNPLHPIFEAWFYPQGNMVQLGYTVENSWASSTASNSARDQVYSVVLTGGNTNAISLFANSSFTQITRTRWHKTFCISGTGAGNPNACGALLHIDHNWGYLAQTKFTPHWDPTLQISSSKIAAEFSGLFNNASALNLGGCATCVLSGAGIGNFEASINKPGASDWHGPLTTWDIMYLMSQCDTGNSTSPSCGNGSGGDMYSVMLTNADLGGMIPYFFREADVNAGHGQFFDAPENTVGTQGRVISINARTQVTLQDVTTSVNQCKTDYAADWINFGGWGQDIGAWDVDTSHWPNLAYASYLTTGQYAYYEEQVMQSANAIGNTGGTHACALPATQASLRQGAIGYWDTVTERTGTWHARENALGAFIAVDGSPEKAYFEDKLRTNLAVWEGSHGIACDIPGTGGQEPYCGGSEQSTAWSYGNTVRIGVPWSGTTLGSWTAGVCSGAQNCYVTNAPLCQTGSGCIVPASANSNFQNDYSGLVIGWINDLGYCPQTNGKCQMLAFVQNWYINVVMNPNASMYVLGAYVYPTLDGSGNQIPNWSSTQQFFASGSWPLTSWGSGSSLCGDEGYGAEGVANLSYGYSLTSNEGYSGSTAYNIARPSLIAACNSGKVTFAGPTGSPKWDITPRQ